MQDIDRSRTLSLPNNVKNTRKPLDKRAGHDTILKTMINKNQRCELEFLDGRSAFGQITQFDNYTITIRDEVADKLKTYYKHAIRSFSAA